LSAFWHSYGFQTHECVTHKVHDDHLHGKAGNIKEFGMPGKCQGIDEMPWELLGKCQWPVVWTRDSAYRDSIPGRSAFR